MRIRTLVNDFQMKILIELILHVAGRKILATSEEEELAKDEKKRKLNFLT